MMADVWFTSDFHLGHFNIIRYCNRPFVDTQEMNAVSHAARREIAPQQEQSFDRAFSQKVGD
jgi:calcineurin-like phosphoesterase family protein